MEWSPNKRKMVVANSLQWAGKSADIWHKMCQIFHQSKKLKDLIMILWWRPVTDFCHFIRVGMHPVGVNFAPKDV